MSGCSCLRGKDAFKFWFNHLDCSTLLYQDFSIWQDHENYVIPESYTVDITPPTRSQPSSIEVKLGVINQISPEDLTLKGSCFVDGVYCFEVQICDLKYTSYRALTCELECCVDDLMGKISPEKEIPSDLEKIRLLIDSIHYNAEHGKPNKARKLYMFAQKLLKSLNCNCLK